MNTNNIKDTITRLHLCNAAAMACNLLLAYLCYALCRVAYVAVNWHTFADGADRLEWTRIIAGSLIFDTSAIVYTNSLYILLMLLPLHMKEGHAWQTVCKWLFVAVNSLAIVMNLADSVYFGFTGRRTTTSVMSEFSNEGNLGSVALNAMLSYWYLVLAGSVMIWLLSRLYVRPQQGRIAKTRRGYLAYYATQLATLLIAAPLCVAGMRGGFTTAVRPITISNANQYVNRPTEAAIVLNTPFSLIRTVGKNVFHDPGYFSAKELESIYSPLHNGSSAQQTPSVRRKKNVVVLIVESFGREYIGAYNDSLDGGNYKGFTPFVDELLQQSLCFDYTFANGRKSIDGMPSILSGIPHFVEPFFLTPASLNDISGLAGELRGCGYSSAFFHGAENGSMGFEAFARTTGFAKYYGRTEYEADKRFGGKSDFDGTWAIWDEPFLQYYATEMSAMREPFVTAVFTASSHHPFAIPQKYEKDFVKPGEDSNPIHKCIRYTDMALRRFFATASRQPWYKNTIFVLTSDHTNILDHKEYATDLGVFGAPILFFDPSGEMPRGRQHCIAQQIDIMPTVLNYLGYSRPYIAFGCDLLNTPAEDTWAVNYSNGIYQYVKGDYVIQFDGQHITAAYNFKHDWMMQRNLKNEKSLQPVFRKMERELKGLIQSYMSRMTENRLIAGK